MLVMDGRNFAQTARHPGNAGAGVNSKRHAGNDTGLAAAACRDLTKWAKRQVDLSG
jgi:hypothetical protein